MFNHKYVTVGVSAVTADYVKRHSPATPRPDYFQYLLGLASELRELKNLPMDLEPDVYESYVYIYLNPLKPGKFVYVCPSGKVLRFKHEPFYVGKGLGRRAKSHLRETLKNPNRSHKNRVIAKIWRAGLEPDIKVIPTRCSDALACAFEIDLIVGIGRHNSGTGPLTNQTTGGDGIPGYRHTKETRELLRKLSTGVPAHNKGVPMTEEAKAHLSKLRKGVPLSEEHRTSLRGPRPCLQGRAFTAEHRANLSKACMGRGKGKPKSSEHNRKNKEANLARQAMLRTMPDIKCPHCPKTAPATHYPAMRRDHYDRCQYKK